MKTIELTIEEQKKLDEYVHDLYEVLDKKLIRRVAAIYDSIYEAVDVIRYYSSQEACEFEYDDIVNALEKHIEESNRYTLQRVITMLFDVKDDELFSRELKQKISIEDALLTIFTLSEQMNIIDYSPESDKTYERLQEYIIDKHFDELLVELSLENNEARRNVKNDIDECRLIEVYEAPYTRDKITRKKIYSEIEIENLYVIYSYVEKAYQTKCVVHYENSIYISRELAEQHSSNKDCYGVKYSTKLDEIKAICGYVLNSINESEDMFDVISYVGSRIKEDNLNDSDKSFERMLRVNFDLAYEESDTTEQHIERTIERFRDACEFTHRYNHIFNEDKARNMIRTFTYSM
ncbi:hypothetical protein ACFKIU_003530 [Vibrio alginolyticus]